ncbi:MAG TPA: TonB-dependent receptor [Bacteroidales bacterium]|nr:TonB-dependent receptor [Bacteroidales bacterium]HRZ20850.1 TonB-dependent receptor [Bacteroidales bacterium]
MRLRILAGIFIMVGMQLIATAQVRDAFVTRSADGISWNEFVERMEQSYPVHFYYIPDSIPDIVVSVAQDSILLTDLLSELFSPWNITVSADQQGNIFLFKDRQIRFSLPEIYRTYISPVEDTTSTAGMEKEMGKDVYLDTYKEFIVENVIIGSKLKGFGSTRATIRGRVTHAEDSSPAVQANVFIEETHSLAVTNDSGYYQLVLPLGKYTLTVSSLGSFDKKYKLTLLSDGVLDVRLDHRVYVLEQVEITSDRYNRVKGSQMGYERLSTKNIKEIPVVLGEKDLIKVALLLPGIQTVGEATSGFNVRGSPTDQNLFYINSVPVYNTSHVFGFFSSFNPEAVQDFSIYKSHIPVQYGGRLSSIFNIASRQGDMKKFSFRGGISPVAARLLVEGPFQKDKSSYMLAVRSTYSDWILNLAKEPDVFNSSAFFADAIANLTFRLDDRNRIDFFSYGSYDNSQIADLSTFTYHNAGASLSWTNLFRKKNSAAVSLIYNRYGLGEQNMEYPMEAYKRSFILHHSELRGSVTLRPAAAHTVDLGMNAILYHASKGDLLPYNETSTIIPESYEPEKGLETAIYAGDEWKLSPRFSVNGGLRYTIYSYLGPKTVYDYIPGLPVEPVNITDTLHYGSNAFIKTYDGLDYRLGATYLLTDQLSVKGSYNRLHQYLFLLSNTIAVAPTDTWKLCDSHIKPMTGDQYTLGMYTFLLGEMYELSLEGYYKNVRNLVEYKDGADLVEADLTETEVIQGDLDSYGIEFMLKKAYGKFSGWVNYTYSRALVLANNPLTGEMNNFGEVYPANFDKPHSFNLVANYRITKRLSFSSNVVYSTGRPVTYPTAIYYLNETQITHYSRRNEYRIPDYFRVDLSMNIEGNLKARKLIHGSFSFSVYNLTGRNNAYSVYFTTEEGKVKAYRLSIFGVPIFSVSYNFKLGNYES